MKGCDRLGDLLMGRVTWSLGFTRRREHERISSFLLLLLTKKKKKNAYSFDIGENYIVTARSQCQCKDKMKILCIKEIKNKIQIYKKIQIIYITKYVLKKKSVLLHLW